MDIHVPTVDRLSISAATLGSIVPLVIIKISHPLTDLESI
eukprot:UN12543